MTASIPPVPVSNDQSPHVPMRPEWLALHTEEVIEPALPIIDPHHHLWDFPEAGKNFRYRATDLLADIGSQNIRATVFIECHTHYRTDKPDAFKCVGEVEFVLNETSELAAQGGQTAVGAAIVANADLLLGAAVRPVLSELVAASADRVRGIRNIAVWHADRSFRASTANPPQGLMLDARFREGFSQLAPLGLTFDAWGVHTQLDELCSLASAFPDTRIVLNHIGGPLAIGPYRGQRDAVFQDWRESMLKLARCANVSVKLGGFGMTWFGLGFSEMPRPAGSEQLAAAIQPYVEACIEAFGADRCMFESNFPVDKGNFSYNVLWNAFKRIASGASDSEKAALFHDTAADFYRIRPC
jgi:predicted TIM-barrel fold metal-dependent hydrolase